MKTRYHHNPLRAAACLVTALCLLCTAACTDDDRTPATDPAPGTVPLILTAGVAAPAATRAATAAGQWTDGDVVAVEMDGVVKRYIASAASTATLRPADEDNTHYWPAKTASVRAWYYGGVTGYTWNRVPDRWDVSATQYATFGGKSAYQQSDFLYAPVQTVTYAPAQQGAAAGLTFYHQTARVVVRIRKAGVVNDVNMGDILVSLGRGPSADEMWREGTFDASPIDPAAGQYSGLTANTEGHISFIGPREIPGIPADGYARCYEALVIPQDMSGKHFMQVRITNADGRGTYYYVPAPGEADLRGGYTYTYDVTVSRHGTLRVTAATPIPGWTDGGTGGSGTLDEEGVTRIDLANPPTISDNGTYLLTGAASDVTLPITGGSPTVIVRDIDLWNSSIHITGGTPEIRVEGTNNYLTSRENPPIWLDGTAANVRITGNGTAASRLSLLVNGDYPNAAIGSKGTGSSKEDHGCGNITISNLRIDANSQVPSVTFGGAAIGTGGGDGSRKCGDITITDAHIAARPGRGAASIGFGCPWSNNMTGTTYEMGDITITGSVIESNISQGLNSVWPAHIGGGAVEAETYKCGNIMFWSMPEKFFTGFTKDGQPHTDGNDVIVGFPAGATPAGGAKFRIYLHSGQWGTPYILWSDASNM